jgi:hypothetical protein
MPFKKTADKSQVKIEKTPAKTEKASVKAAAPALKMVSKKATVENSQLSKVKGHQKIQTAEGWKRMIKKEKGIK